MKALGLGVQGSWITTFSADALPRLRIRALTNRFLALGD